MRRQTLVRPKISVILVNYNSGAGLERCLTSLLNTNSKNDEVEFILIDNASTDGSAQAIARCFPQVRLIWSDFNLGFGGGNNLGVRYARGDFLAFLNPDTVVEPGWLEALVAALEDDPRAGMVTSRILMLDQPETVNTCGNDVHLTGLTLCRGMGRPRQGYDCPAEVSAVSGAAFAIRKDLYQALGGFDAELFLYMEDTDLSWRARLAGWRILYVPSSIVYHDYRLTFSPNKTYYLERNRYMMLLKTLHWRTLLALVPALLLAEMISWAFVLTRERRNWRNKLRAYGWVIQHWDHIRQEREVVQQLRQVSDRALLHTTHARLSFEQTGVGLPARIAHWVFDPLFLIYRRGILGVQQFLRD
jgi:hypothetical protein